MPLCFVAIPTPVRSQALGLYAKYTTIEMQAKEYSLSLKDKNRARSLGWSPAV
jgi:hypothetical protein